ncbi:MAG TPA: nitroreductase family protein, partial [Armatimonadota bacterium]|nr:nitroreductase family protein [Armatimonadota bacterium]
IPAFVKSIDAGRDRLFFEAPVVVVVHSDKHVVMPEATCAFASLTLTLMAEASGLASCMIGFASDALRCRDDLREQLGIPAGNQVYYVLVMGYPLEHFTGIPEREPPNVSWR